MKTFKRFNLCFGEYFMKNFLLIPLTALAVSVCLPFTAGATANCDDVPDCAEIGFPYTASQCGNHEMLKCPFDDDHYFCSLSNAPTTNCDTSLGLYDTCPTGALCPDGIKSNGCYMASRCFKAQGYLDEQPTGKTCDTDDYINYLGESKTCYSNCGCTTSQGYFGSKTLCQNYQLTADHLYCEIPSGQECYKGKAGYCSETACYEDGECHEQELCNSTQHYYTGYGRVNLSSISGQTTCYYRKRKTNTISNSLSAQECVDPEGEEDGVTLYSKCACKNDYMLEQGSTATTTCRCRKKKELNVVVREYNGGGAVCTGTDRPFRVVCSDEGGVTSATIKVKYRTDGNPRYVEKTMSGCSTEYQCVGTSVNFLSEDGKIYAEPVGVSITFYAGGTSFTNGGYQDISLSGNNVDYYDDTAPTYPMDPPIR